MRRPEPSPEALALAEARWTALDLVSRRPPQLAPDLLRGRAAELAGSASEHERRLARLLERAADDLEQGRPPLQHEEALALPAPSSQRSVQRLWWWAGAALVALLGLLTAYG